MTQKKDNASKLRGCSTGQLCSVAQYVAELVCLRKAERDNVGSLEYKFWNKSRKDQYQIQVRAASKLVKKYSEKALLKYITSPSGKNIYSLGFLGKSKAYVVILKFVDTGVAKTFKILESQTKEDKKVLDVPENIEYKAKKQFSKQSTLFAKIRNIEDGKRKET
jgi:hypothetical protein